MGGLTQHEPDWAWHGYDTARRGTVGESCRAVPAHRAAATARHNTKGARLCRAGMMEQSTREGRASLSLMAAAAGVGEEMPVTARHAGEEEATASAQVPAATVGRSLRWRQQWWRAM